MEENKMKKSKFEKLVDKIRNGIGVPKAVLSMPRHEAKLALGYAVTHGARSLARNAVLGLAGVMALAGCGKIEVTQRQIEEDRMLYSYLPTVGDCYLQDVDGDNSVDAILEVPRGGGAIWRAYIAKGYEKNSKILGYTQRSTRQMTPELQGITNKLFRLNKDFEIESRKLDETLKVEEKK